MGSEGETDAKCEIAVGDMETYMFRFEDVEFERG